ncbi:hypothetical protein HMPREF0063_12989 [Aeromicrobium marinum DSM 15272]|uniref:Tat pathway signal sequence domain protein n=1 Tax=Aeromicrobium marinum DSM 15272 TaxID=585531 RepID=E2SG30_9ACTN|nr:DUF6541 family protein [Aeromicrobium marinum]EFQ81787.1 hypothetical protein HMPREF0063_12989 [Aeromicrobium marinum DSM 15272]
MWSEVVLPLAATLALLGVPGLVLGAAAGLRGAWLAAATAPLSVTTVATASVVAEWGGVTWSVVPVVVMTAAAAVVLAAGRRVLVGRWGSDEPRGAAGPWPVLLAVGLAAGLIGRRLWLILQRPDAVSQSYDNIFHLNAVQYVLQTGSASPFTVGGMTSPEGNLGFYPSAWHAVVSLVADLTGAGVPVAVTAVTLVVACVVWPLSVVVLARTWFGTSAALTVAAGVLAAATAAFPFLLLTYGILYPLFLSGAVLPLAVAALARAAGVGVTGPPRGVCALLLVGVVPGMAVAHPSALVALLAFSVPVAAVVAVRHLRHPSRRVPVVAAVAAYLVLGLVAVRVIRPPADQIYWPTIVTTGQAVGEVLTASVYGMPVAIALALLTLLGIVVSLRGGRGAGAAASGAFVIAGLLYVLAAGSQQDWLRTLLVGPWYNNPPRLAALVPLAMIPLAARGAEAVHDRGRAWLRDRDQRIDRPRARAVVAVVGVVALVVATHVGGPLRQITTESQRSFALVDDAWLLTPDESRLLERVPDLVPPDSVIAGSPYTGAGLALALADRRVLMPHLLMDIGADTARVNRSLRFATPGSETCAAIDRLGVDFVLDFGEQQINNYEVTYPGLENLERSDAVEEIDREGEAVLYRVVGC